MATKKNVKVVTGATKTPESSPVKAQVKKDQQIDLKDVEDGFPIIGIGASAGGLGAFEAFFSGMLKDRDINMAFVLVQHLAPDHKSMLTELIQRCTQMQVFEVSDGVVVQPNCTYVIPPRT